MNAKHTLALVLLAVGGFALVLSGIAVSQWPSAAGGWIGGALALCVLGAAVRLYRRSDHQLMTVPDPDGAGTVPTLPILSPARLLVYGLVTVCGVVWWLGWSDAERTEALDNPSAIRAAGLWVAFTVVLLAELWNRWRNRDRKSPPEPGAP